MDERAKKPEFKPVLTRVKLNPEQAVLQCSCYSMNRAGDIIAKGGTLACSFVVPKLVDHMLPSTIVASTASS